MKELQLIIKRLQILLIIGVARVKNGCHGNQLKQNTDQKNRHVRFSIIGMKDLQLSYSMATNRTPWSY